MICSNLLNAIIYVELKNFRPATLRCGTAGSINLTSAHVHVMVKLVELGNQEKLSSCLATLLVRVTKTGRLDTSSNREQH